jgi:hypothetical protein
MRRFAQFKYIAPAIHALLFIAFCIICPSPNHCVAPRLAVVLFEILWRVDWPFSIVVFGIMYEGGRGAMIAVIVWWGVGCTLWWHVLGRGMDALVRRFRRSQSL